MDYHLKYKVLGVQHTLKLIMYGIMNSKKTFGGSGPKKESK